jgi:SAM-dependent methyltransferase
MEYREAFNNREKRYEYAINKYQNVLRNEFEVAVKVLDLKESDNLVNIPAGGVPIHRYIDKNLNINYLPYEVIRDDKRDDMKYCDFTNIPLHSRTIDKLITLASFHHVQEEREEALKEFKRILKDDGVLVIGDVIEGSKQAYWLNVFVNKYNSNGHNGLFLKESDVFLIKNIGFNVETSIHTYNWIFENDECAIDFIINLFGLDLLDDKELLLTAMKDILDYKDNKFEWQLMYFKCRNVL